MARNSSNLNKFNRKHGSSSHKSDKEKTLDKKLKSKFEDENKSVRKPEKKQAEEQHTAEILSQNPSFFQNYSKYIFPVVVLFSAFLVYYTALDNDFVNWDDDRYVTLNPNLALTWENIKLYFGDFYFVMYIPLTMLSYMLDYELAGLDSPEFFHFHSVLLHVINSLLVYFVVAKMFKKIASKNFRTFGLISALLFAVHPLHIASVTWIAERKDVLFTMYFLAAWLAYLFYLDRKNLALYAASLVFFILSSLAKSQSVTLPIVLILTDYLINRIDLSKDGIKKFFAEKKFFTQKAINDKIPFFIIALAVGIVAVIAAGTEEPFAENVSNPDKISTSSDKYTLFQTFLFMNYSFVQYIVKLIVPYNLSAIHPYPIKPNEAMPVQFYLYPLANLGLIALTVWAFIKKYKTIVFAITFFVANIVLVLSIKNFIISEHYTYMPSIGLNIIFAYLFFEISKKNIKLKPLISFMIGIYLLVLGVFTFQRNDVFQNSETFWTDVLKKYDNITIAYYNRGNYFQALGDKETENQDLKLEYYQKAIADYDSTTALHKYNIGAFSNRGVTKAKIGDAQGAVQDFMEVVSIDSTYGNVYSNLGNASAMLGEWEKAIKNYDKALVLRPNLTEAYFNRGIAKKTVGRYAEAITDFNTLLQKNPNYQGVHFHRGYCYYSLNKLDSALIDFDLQIAENPNVYNTYYYVAKVYEQKNMPEKANENYKILANNFPQIVQDLSRNADSYEKQGDYSQNASSYQTALSVFEDALKISPNNSTIYSRIGVLKGKLGNIDLAINDFNKAIEIDSLNSQAFSDRGFAYFLKNNLTKAEADFKTAVILNPADANTFFNLGILYNKQNKNSQALENFSKAIEISPQYAMAYLNRGISYIKANKQAEACNDFSVALQLGVQDAQLYLNEYCKK